MVDTQRQRLITNVAKEIFKLHDPAESELDFLQQVKEELGDLTQAETLFLHSFYKALIDQNKLS